MVRPANPSSVLPDAPRPDAVRLVESLIDLAVEKRASDIHIEPTAQGCELRLRVDGLLETVATHDAQTGRSIVQRLMVIAHLLTYRLDVPQEGRASVTTRGEDGRSDRRVELRVSVMPTTHGL